MLLSDIFEYLTYGELSQLSIGIGDDGAVASTDYPKLVSYINMGLIELYKRFPVNEKQLVVQQADAVTRYHLTYPYALYNTGSAIAEVDRYIMDTAEAPFLGDVLRIEQVFNELGEELPLNNSEDDTSLFAPTVTDLQIPQPNAANSTIVLYRASPKKITIPNLDPFTEDVLLPEALLEALLFYVGARAQGSILSGSDADNSFRTKYENSCAWVERQGLLQSENNSNIKPEREGWV
jgi:hypothetical protein